MNERSNERPVKSQIEKIFWNNWTYIFIAIIIHVGNFNYVPKEDKVDFDITTYENLNKNTAFGINSQVDDSNISLN